MVPLQATGSIPGWKRKRERETSCFVYSKENDRVSVSTSKSQESLFCSRGSISFLDPRALKSVESEVEGTGIKSSTRVVSSNSEGRDFPCGPVVETLHSQCLWPRFHPWSGNFPGGSAGKGSACNAGDPRSIPGSGRSSGDGIGYPLQLSWASLVAQLVKDLPAMQDTWVRSLGWEDPLEIIFYVYSENT